MNPASPQSDLLRAPTAEELARVHSWVQVGLQRLVDAVLQPSTFLAAVVWLLGGTYTDVAVIAVAAAMSYALGSVVMPFALARVDDIRLVLLGASVVRALASAIIAVVGWRAGSLTPDAVVMWLVVGVLFYQVSSATNVSRNPRSFIANQDQPTSARSRQIVGALSGVFGGLVAWRTLGNNHISFEESAGMLLFLAGSASLGSVWFQITAPVRYRDLHQKLPVPAWSEIQEVLSNGEVKRYIWIRLMFGLSTFADPFLIIFGMYQMRLNLWYVGAVILTVVLAQIAGGAIWTFFGDMPGSRKAIQFAAILRFAALTLAVAVPFIATSSWYRSTFETQAVASWLFVAVFFLIGLSQNSLSRNEQHYAMNRLRDGRLFPALDFVLNTVLVIVSLTPFLGVLLITSSSLRMTIALAAGVAFIAFLSTAFLVARKRLRRRRLAPDLRGSVKPLANRAERTGTVKIRRIRK